MRRLAPLLVRQTDAAHFHHRRMRQEGSVDLDRRDALAAADDHGLDAVADFDETVGMHDGGVAAVEPPVADDGGRRLRIPVVPLHHDVATRDDLAECFTVARYLVAFGCDDPELARGDELNALTGLD